MSGFTQFLGAIAGQVASRVIMNKVANVGLSQAREPSREPGGYKPPVIVPKGAEFDRPEAGVPSGRYKIPTWLFFTGYGALLWYAAKATAPVDMPDLGDPGPEEALLFPGLKRELTHLDVEDISTSDDPVEACLERAGWKLPRIDELRQSIFEKEQVDLFTTPEPLTRSEGELLEAIESCMQRLEIQYGSLEAAGVVCSDCGQDGDLPSAYAAVQREMFDPEQIEIDYDPAPDPQGTPNIFWFFIAKGHHKGNLVTQDQIDSNPEWYFSAEKDKKGKLYQVEADTKVKALTKLHDQLKAAREYTKEYGQKQNKFTPWFHPVENGGKGYRIIPNIMAHPETGYGTEEAPRLYEYLDTLEPGEPANVLDACNFIHGSGNCESAQMESVIDLVKQEGYFYLDDLRKAYKDKAEIPAHRKTGG